MSDAGASIRLREWLDARVPAPPPALAERLHAIVRDDSANRSDLPSALLTRAEALLRDAGNDREYAVTLLAADALITYAMEAAAEACIDLEKIAADAGSRLSAGLK